MSSHFRISLRWTVRLALSATAVLAAPLFGQDNIASLRIADESAPAGGVAQVKLELTEPRPIIVVRSRVRSSSSASVQMRSIQVPLRAAISNLLGSVRGARAFSASGMLAGTATISGDSLRFQILSPDGQLGLAPDTPLAVISVAVNAGVANGQTAPLDLDLGELVVQMPGGQEYGKEFKPGTFTVGGVAIHAIEPAGDMIPQGTQIIVRGSGFQPGGELDINEVATTPVQFISANEIRVVAQQAFSLHGKRIRWRNPNGVREEFFAVSSSPTSLPGTASLIANTFPLFGAEALTRVRVAYGAEAGLRGLGIENPGGAEVELTIRAMNGAVPTQFSRTVTIPPGGVRTEDLATLFQTANHGATAVEVEAATPVRVMGLLADTAQSVVNPIVATAATPTVVSLAAAVDGASFAGGGIAPGEIVSLFGGPFAPAGRDAQAIPLPAQIDGVSVTMNGIPAPLYFVGEQQINCQAPLGLTGTEVSIRVSIDGEAKASLTVPLRPVAPGIFTFDFSGTGPGVIAENASGRVVTPATPLRTGQFAVIYCSGLGAVSNAPPDGAASPLSPLAETLVKPEVTVGGMPVEVLFSGLTPGFAGLYQVNIPIGPNLPRGNAVPVELRINGVAANRVTTAIQ